MPALLAFAFANPRLIFYGGLIAAIIGFGLHEWHVIYVSGQRAALEQVEKANEQANKAANSGSTSVDACFAAGGTWDRATGVCQTNAGQ